MPDFKKFNLIQEGKKKEKREEVEVQFLSKKQFKKIKDDKETELIGKTTLKKFTDKDKEKKDIYDYSILKLDADDENEYIIDGRKEGKDNNIFHRTVGYFMIKKENTEKGQYIRYYKKNFVIIILFALLTLGALGIGIMGIATGGKFFDKAQKTIDKVKEIVIDDDAIDNEDEKVENGKSSQASAETIDLPGYGEITVDANEKEIPLMNPEINAKVNVYFKYTVIDVGTQETIFETKYIKPGKARMWDAYDDLYSFYGDGKFLGKHSLIFHIQTVDSETGKACNGGKLSVTVVVE